MSDHEHEADQTVPVRVSAMPAPRIPVYRTVYKVVTLQAAGEGQELLPASDSRCVAYVYPLDDDVIISGNKSDAAAGAGTPLPTTLTAPWPIQDSAAVYVAAQSISGVTARVAVTDTHMTYE